MRDVLKLTAVTGALAVGLAALGVAAQDEQPSPARQPPMAQGQGTMPMMGMMREMSQMMETCNRMMQAHMAQPQQTPNKQ